MSVVIAQVTRETNNNTHKKNNARGNTGHPISIAHTTLGNLEEVATRDVNNNSHWHGVSNDIRLLPFAHKYFSQNAHWL